MKILKNIKKRFKLVLNANDLNSVLAPLFFLSEHISMFPLSVTTEGGITTYSLSLSGFLSSSFILIYYVISIILAYIFVTTNQIKTIILIATLIQIITGKICVIVMIFDRFKNGYLTPNWFIELLELDKLLFNQIGYKPIYKGIKVIVCLLISNYSFIIILIFVTNCIVSVKYTDHFHLHRVVLVLIPMTYAVLHVLRYCCELCLLVERYTILNQLLVNYNFLFRIHDTLKIKNIRHAKRISSYLDIHYDVCEMFEQLNDIHGLLDFVSCLCLLVLSVFTIYSLLGDFLKTSFDVETGAVIFTKIWWLLSSHAMCLLLMKLMKKCTLQVRTNIFNFF